jgi:hypothetical protein
LSVNHAPIITSNMRTTALPRMPRQYVSCRG